MGSASYSDLPPRGAVPVITRRVAPDLTVHAVRSGWVRVKEAHRTLRGPTALRTLAIVAGRRWTEWMPVIVYVIDHPEGVFLVDAGQSEAMLDPQHFECDALTAWVYRTQLRFSVEADDRLDRRLAALGIDAARIRAVVLTHRHADHADGLDALPAGARVIVGEKDWPSHQGALPCRWPEGRTPTLVGDGGPPFGAFAHSTALTQDRRLRVIPLPGHSPGHLGVLLETEGSYLLFAGDAAFSLSQVRDRQLAGIVEVPDAARATLDSIAEQLHALPTFLLLAHDADALERWSRDEWSRP